MTRRHVSELPLIGGNARVLLASLAEKLPIYAERVVIVADGAIRRVAICSIMPNTIHDAAQELCDAHVDALVVPKRPNRAAIMEAMRAEFCRQGRARWFSEGDGSPLWNIDGCVDPVALADAIIAALSPPAKAETPQSQGGKARAAALDPERRSEIARNAAQARWNKPSVIAELCGEHGRADVNADRLACGASVQSLMVDQ